MDAKRTTDRPKIDTIDGKEIKKKIFNYAREYAFDKITKTLDKKMAKETIEVGGGNAARPRKESQSTLMLRRERQYSDCDDNDDECDLVPIRDARQCQAFMANERRISGRHLQQQQQQQKYSKVMQQKITTNRRHSSRIVMAPTQNWIVPGRATMLHDRPNKRLNHMSRITINNTDNDDTDNYLTADDLDDADNFEDYDGDSDDGQVILRAKQDDDGQPAKYRALSSGQFYLDVDDDDNDNADKVGMWEFMIFLFIELTRIYVITLTTYNFFGHFAHRPLQWVNRNR